MNTSSPSPSDPPSSVQVSPKAIAPVNEVGIILIIVSIFLIGGTAILKLDFLPATLIGTLIVGLNFYWTRHIVLKFFKGKHIKRRMLIFYFLKFGISVAVLFTALIYFQLSAIGMLIGVSNIALAVMIYSVVNVFRTEDSSDSSDSD